MVVEASYINKEQSDEQGGDVTGILAVQGAFAEHAAMLDTLHAPWRLLRSGSDWDETITRVILPGGESTTQGKLLNATGLFEPISRHISEDKPVLATCAGMILLAERLEDDDQVHFGALHATIRRNAYGRQLGSFTTTGNFGDLTDVPMVFVRAPFVVSVGSDVTIESVVDGHAVALRQHSIIATAFHPELTNDTRVHQLFLSL